MKRHIYLVSYDISCPHRLARVLKAAQAYRVEGQKSMYECWLSSSELIAFRQQLSSLIDPLEDRVHIMVLDTRMTPQLWGKAHTFIKRTFFIIV
jgi:CRISPR-associated protein Cas2